MTQYAIAGIMGNLQQESNLRPDNVQNGMGYEDADYVAGIKSGEITREEFINDSSKTMQPSIKQIFCNLIFICILLRYSLFLFSNSCLASNN